MKPYLIISFGMLVYAFAATGFLVPHKIVGGGATGIATVLFYLFKIPVGIGYFLVNILLLIIAMKVLGPKFGIKTIFAIIVGSVFLGIMQPLMPVDGILPDEKFMSTIIAAMLTGIGIGGILNIALDPLLIFGFGMDIGGAAVATLISQVIGFIVLLSFFRKKTILRFSIRKISKKFTIYKEFIGNGMPSLFR